jgi:hypothetical protein
MTEINRPFHVLFLSYDGMTDPLGQSQVLPYLMELRKKGYCITLMSFEKKIPFEKNKSNIQQLTDDSGIEWIPMKYHKKPPVISTILDIQLMKLKISSINKKTKIDLVHCRGYITAFGGMWMKKKWGTPFLFDMRGFFPDERVEGGIWKLKNPLYKSIYDFFKNKEKDFFLHADHVISLTNEGEKTIRSFPYIPSEWKCTVIPCCVDRNHFQQKNVNHEITENFISQFNLTRFSSKWFYLGSVGTWYMLPEMLDFFKVVLENDEKSVLAFFTHDSADYIQQECQKRNIPLNNIIIHPLQRKEIPSVISLFDAALFFIKPVFSKKASSPTKQGEIMSMGIPMVCNADVGDTEFIVQKYKAGICIKHFNRDEYLRAYREIKAGNYDVSLSVQGAEEWYALEKGVNAYHNVYKQLLLS